MDNTNDNKLFQELTAEELETIKGGLQEIPNDIGLAVLLPPTIGIVYKGFKDILLNK